MLFELALTSARAAADQAIVSITIQIITEARRTTFISRPKINLIVIPQNKTAPYVEPPTYI